jgi:predicted RNA-binding protein YlqC (UPF0109 family)
MSSQQTQDLMDESELLLELVRHVVSHPEEVSIDAVEGTITTVFTITVAQDDRGRVIGKDRRTLEAIEHLFAKSASMDGRKATIKLGGKDQRRRSRPPPQHEFRRGV